MTGETLKSGLNDKLKQFGGSSQNKQNEHLNQNTNTDSANMPYHNTTWQTHQMHNAHDAVKSNIISNMYQNWLGLQL